MNNINENAKHYGRLQDQLLQIDRLVTGSFYTPDFQAWHRQTGELLEKIYGLKSGPYEMFQAILFTPLFLSCRCSDTVFTDAYEQGLEEVRSLLASCLNGA